MSTCVSKQGHVCATPISESIGQGYEEILSNVVKTGQAFSANELTVSLPRGEGVETIFVNFTYEPLSEEYGTISGIMAVATDVTGNR